MACGVAQMMAFVWYLRDKAKGDTDDGILPPPNTAATTRDSRFEGLTPSQSPLQVQHQTSQGSGSNSEGFNLAPIEGEEILSATTTPIGRQTSSDTTTVEDQAPARLPVLTSPISGNKPDAEAVHAD